MSSPKRRTRTSSGGTTGTTVNTASTGNTGTIATRRLRERPPKNKTAESPPPPPARKRKLRDEARHDSVFAIKDIVGEKVVDGKRFYKIDWADHPTTGESFEPTWEPEENANEDAVVEWELQKRQRVLPSATPSPSTGDQATESSSSKPLSGGFYVELQSKSDFLRSRPNFDTANVIPFSESQLSHFPHSDSEIELPPSQFCVISSQPIQDIVIADSQPAAVQPSSPLQTATASKAPAISQTTIPDSQDFSNDFSQYLVEVPGTAEEDYQLGAPSPKNGHNNSSGSSIPSRQPDANQVSFGYLSVSIDTERHQPSQQNLPLPHPPSNSDAQASDRPFSSRNFFGGFLTQPEFEAGEFSLSVDSKSQSQPQEATAATDQQLPAISAEDTPLDGSHQPAQRVSPLPSQTFEFLTQSEVEFFSASEDYEVVPDTSQRNSGQSQRCDPQLSEQSVTHNARVPTDVHSQPITESTHTLSRHTQSQSYSEDSRGVLDELRAIQLEFTPVHMHASILGNNSGAIRANDEPPTPVSPSDILSSVEQDNLENEEQAALQSAEGSTSWGHEPDPVLFADSLDPQHGSASAAESNMASLATTTPASGAIEQATDVEMAYAAAAALTSGIEAGLQSNNNVLDTISPSALLAVTGPDALPEASFQETLEPLVVASVAEETKDHDTAMQDGHDFGILPLEDTAANEYIIALPPPARSRAETVEIIRTHRQEIDSFEAIFSRDGPRSLDNKATVKIDAMLQSLNELSNLPPYHKDLPDLSQDEWMRYARDTTSKLAFIYELLNRLRTVDVEIAILVAGDPVLEKVEAIVGQGGFTYRRVQQQEWSQASDEQGSDCKIVLIDTSQAGPRPRSTENIVIAYDETAESSGLLHPYKTNQVEDQTPMIFSLVGVYSLEHINRRLSPAMDPLEKKLAQVKCLVATAKFADDEDEYEQIPQPHEFAQDLVQYMVDEDGFRPPPVRWASWDHQRVPELVFNSYKAMRGQMVPYGSRKRAREDSSGAVDTPKRARVEIMTDDVQLSDGLRARFGNDIRVRRGMAEVSLEKLEDLIGLVRDLTYELDRKDEDVKSHVKTIRRFEPKYYEAIGDRGNFEQQRDQVIKGRDRLQKELDRRETQVTRLTEEKKELEDRLQELTKADNPDLAASAQREIDLKLAQEKAVFLERQIKITEETLSYAQSRYQDASDKAGTLGKENREQQLQIKDLETRANAIVVEIRRMNIQRTDAKLRQMYEQEKALRLDREREIDRKNEEMRSYKSRFGGRETRGSSVPRSPRVRQMSSRNTSPVGDNGGNGNGGIGGVGGSLLGPRSAHLRE